VTDAGREDVRGDKKKGREEGIYLMIFHTYVLFILATAGHISVQSTGFFSSSYQLIREPKGCFFFGGISPVYMQAEGS
jgi:hypothetical protein